MKIAIILITFLVAIFACGPDPVPPQCNANSIDYLDGEIYDGHITLCNAQSGKLVYEPGTLFLQINNNLLYLHVVSTSPSLIYDYKDTVHYSCIIEEYKRSFEFYNNLQDSIDMGEIDDFYNRIHLRIIDSMCSNSSFFEGER